MPTYTTRDELSEALTDADYPASKEELTGVAGRNGAQERTVCALRALPPVEYRSFEEVLASVDLADEEARLAAAQEAQRRRMHTHDGLAEHEKDLPAPNPIIEELGGNRGS